MVKEIDNQSERHYLTVEAKSFISGSFRLDKHEKPLIFRKKNSSEHSMRESFRLGIVYIFR